MKPQKEFEGMESPSIPEIEEAADQYVKVRDKRMKLLEQEITLKAALTQIMIAHEKELNKNAEGASVYRFDDELVILSRGKERVKVKTAHDDEDEEDED